MTFNNRIGNDLKESQINWMVIISFIPIAFFAVFSRFGNYCNTYDYWSKSVDY